MAPALGILLMLPYVTLTTVSWSDLNPQLNFYFFSASDVVVAMYFFFNSKYLLLFSRSGMSDCLWPHGLQHTRLSFTIFSSLLKLMSVELVMPSNHHSFISMNIQGWYPLGLTSLISLLSKGLSNLKPSVSQFESISSLVLNLLYDPALTCNWIGRWCQLVPPRRLIHSTVKHPEREGETPWVFSVWSGPWPCTVWAVLR